MTHLNHDQEVQLQRTLDRLNITPQQLFDFHHTLATRVASTPEWFNPNLQRSSGQRFARPLRAWHINPDTLDQKLTAMFDVLGVGFCYVLNRNGTLVHRKCGGAARLATPDISILTIRIAAVPAIAWDYGVPANLCSVSKVITAIATTLLLRDHGIAPETPVTGFLPDYWKRPSSTDVITFRDLLRHESGLGASLNVPSPNSGPGDFSNARDQFERGSTGTGLTTVDYKNLNYTILRATFPIVAGLIDPALSVPGFNDAVWGLATATAYRDFVNQRVFAPAGVGPFEFEPGPDAARAYGTPPSPPGAQLADVTSDAGSSGWHLSIDDLMRVVAEFRHGGTLMTAGQAQQLLADRYGVNEIFDTNAGAVYAKRGRYNDGGVNTLDTAVYMMPDRLELGVFINSGPASGPAQASYNDAIQQHIIDSAEET
jgi:CubicO group peptidase (beta-lactamase class C family)